MRRFGLALWLAVGLSGAALAEDDAATLARAASDDLGQAAVLLSEAEGATDRIAALTQTIRAYEAGLSAMREGLRRVVLSERELEARLGGEDAELQRLLALLQEVSVAGDARSVFHPGGAVETVRAGVLASSMVPALRERTATLENELADLRSLRIVREAGLATLNRSLEQLREARLALSQAISERTDLPDSLATDDAAMEALINSSETLAAFADSLATSDEPSVDAGGDWTLPVEGERSSDFNETDAAGVVRPGWTIATGSEALVTAPAAASVRFSGSMAEQGPVVILEPAPGTLMILSGFGQSFVVRDQIVAKGEPIALMEAATGVAQENLNETSLLGGQSSDETLYIEVRRGQAPVDPAAFFRPTGE